MRTLGFDPGNKGALALYDTAAPKVIEAWALPVIIEQRSKTKKTFIDEMGLCALLRSIGEVGEVWIEDVFSSSQMGVVSAFSFGEGKGIIKGCVAGVLKLAPHYVSPATWKAAMRVTADKNQTKRMARAIFRASPLSTEGKCEAALIALYGSLRRQANCLPHGTART